MRILCTGSRGVLGVPLVKRLRENGHEVWGCDLAHSGDENYIRCDVSVGSEVRRLFNTVTPQVVYHLAGEFGRLNGDKFYERLWATNVIGTQHVIEGSRWQGSKLIFASSSEAYGYEHAHPMIVPSVMREDDRPGRWHCQYALSKYVNEKQIEISGIPAVSLRFFNVFGDGEKFTPYRSVICQFIHKMLRDEPVTAYQNMSRDFLYITDFVDTVSRVCERFDGLPPVINIGGTESMSIENLAVLIKELTQSKSEIFYLPAEQNNVRVKKPDLTLAQKYLSHDPKVSLRDGLIKTIEWMKEQK